MDWLSLIFDPIFIFLQDIGREVSMRLDYMTFMHWIALLMPFFWFAELPRYIFPAIYLLCAQIFGWKKDDVETKRKYLLTKPKISFCLIGLNEGESIANSIRSLLELDYPNKEIIVYDDNSTDNMYEEAKPFADAGQIRLFKNTAASGRGGKPAGSNAAFHVASGEIIFLVDCDTSFDRHTILHMVGPFHDPKVGIVAGNIKVRNAYTNALAAMQGSEYLISIGMWKEWLNTFNMNYLASGAFGAFRREAIERVGGWDPELAEDADLSMKIKRSGYRMEFAPKAIAMTNAPTSLRVLVNQRIRWDRGMVRTYFRKHRSIMKFWIYDWRNFIEISQEILFAMVFAYGFAAYTLIMLFVDPFFFFFVYFCCTIIFMASTAFALAVHLAQSERRKQEMWYLMTVPIMPFYKEFFRWVRIYAITLELLRVNYENSFLPKSSWNNTKKW